MADFDTGRFHTMDNPSIVAQLERDRQEAFDGGMSDFFDPAVDEHSEFYSAMEKDKHAAHLVAGTSFLDLNTMILKTECNNAYESMNEADMQRLRKLMWDVYIPHMKESLQSRVSPDEDDMESFRAQMHVVHISVRVAQALQLIFELNQKKSFSAVAKTAYEVALQDVLYHPHIKGKVVSSQYGKLINFMRRHPTYATPFNTYVGYKLLRQQLVRGGGAGTNRKSNDAERLHDESANRLWSVLDQNRNIAKEFANASPPFIMDWHRLYYKEVAETLFKKLKANAKDTRETEFYPTESVKCNDDREKIAKTVNLRSIVRDDHARPITATPVSAPVRNVDILSAIQDSRDTFSEGIIKRAKTTHID